MAGSPNKFYQVSGGKLSRTHKPCPKCGAGVFLAQHEDRSHCGKCGFTERNK